jgi:hypothetical protein
MRRLPRILFNAAAVLSLVLCVATMVLWPRSYSSYDRFIWMSPSRAELIGVERGTVVWVLLRRDPAAGDDGAEFPDPPGFTYHADQAGDPLLSSYMPTDDRGWRAARLAYHDDVAVLGVFRARVWIVPFWMPVAGMAILPLVWAIGLRKLRRQRRKAAGLCEDCGYDLRGSPERCPECGTIPAR